MNKQNDRKRNFKIEFLQFVIGSTICLFVSISLYLIDYLRTDFEKAIQSLHETLWLAVVVVLCAIVAIVGPLAFAGLEKIINTIFCK